MPYEDLLSGLIELHVLYHAAEEEIFGLGMLKELKGHGYRISPGTLYPLLHRLMHRGYLTVREVRLGRARRRLYRATPRGYRALASLRHHVRELTVELGDEGQPGGRRSRSPRGAGRT
jgi:PadR family transcriptional regulator, regulatory protein PadR